MHGSFHGVLSLMLIGAAVAAALVGMVAAAGLLETRTYVCTGCGNRHCPLRKNGGILSGGQGTSIQEGK